LQPDVLFKAFRQDQGEVVRIFGWAPIIRWLAEILSKVEFVMTKTTPALNSRPSAAAIGAVLCSALMVVTATFAASALIPAGDAMAQAAPSDRLFKQKCAMCHSNVAGKTNPMGPNLFGVFGRRAGSTGFAYSPAMKKSGLVWNAQNLDKLLKAPSQTVPGTRMVMAVPDPAQRAEIIRYLQRLK
jgi:cytochrome c